MTFLFSEIDKSKLSYNFKFKYDLPKNILFKKSSTKTSINVDRVTKKVVKKIPRRLISPAIINDNSTDEITDLGSKTIISVSEDSSGSITNGGGDTYPQGTSENQDNTHPQSISGNHNVTQLYSTEQNCSFRVRKVPEINNAGFSGESNCTKEDTVNKYDENLTFNNEINCNKSNETNSCVKKETHSDVQSHSTSDFFHNPKPNQPLKLIKLDGNNSAENSLIPSNLKTLSSCIVQTKTGMRLVFNPKLVKDNRLNGTNSKIIKISNIGVVSNGQKKTILVKRKYVDVKQPCVITIPPDDTQNTKLNYVENRKHFLTKNSIMSLKSKTSDTNINTNDTCDLNVSNTFYDSRDTLSVPNNSLQKLENNFNLPEESIPCDSEIFDKESINLETPGNNTIDEDRDSNSLEDCINLQPGHNINQSDDRLVEFHPQDNQQTCNEKNISDYSPMKSLDKSIIDNRTEAGNGSYGKSTNSQSLEPLNVNSNGNKFFKNNCQELKKDNPIAISKQGLSSDENEQSRKKLRSEILRPCLLKSSHQRGDPVLLQDLKILIRRNGFDRTYFFSVKNNCYLPKFHGFKKHEVRPRSMLIALKKLQRLSKN